MNYSQITANKISATQVCPTSKSYANRALILAALKEESIKIVDLPESQDVKDMLIILSELGLEIEKVPNAVIVKNSFPECEKEQDDPIKLSGSEGGTTIRFLMALLSLGKNQYILPLKGRLSKRPIDSFLNNFEELKVDMKLTGSDLYIKGPLQTNNETLEVDCSETTQFASALVLISEKINLDLQFKKLIVSKKYLEMTENVLLELKNNNEYIVPCDASSLGYFLAYAVLNQDLVISNCLAPDPLQADSKFFEVLDLIGARYEFSNDGLRIFQTKNLSELKPFSIDGSQCIDLVPTLVLLASFISDRCEIKNITFLKHKESDRLQESLNLLKHFNVSHKYDEKNDLLSIDSFNSSEYRQKIETAEDHRMVMVASLYLKLLNGGEVAHIDCTSKSFPDFYDRFS